MLFRSHQGHPSPLNPAQSPYPPPPYQPLNSEQYQPVNTEHKPSVHFTPGGSPAGQHRPSFGGQPRPDSFSASQPNYQAQQMAPYQQTPYIPQGYPYQQPPTFQQVQYQPRPSYSASDAYGPGYISDPEAHRRKHKSRSRRISDNSRSTNTDALLGAAGGSLIGDLIFPGLGTVGGALVGWVGGKDYGKHRKWREDKRDQQQDRWERRFADRSRSRSRSRERRKDRHERRRS